MLPAARSRSRRAGQVLTVDWGGGEKLTVGARASVRYLRIYAKGDRVRHELELKQDAAAPAMARLCSGESLLSVWASEYGRVVTWQ
jgi:DNA relaxase NicK